MYFGEAPSSAREQNRNIRNKITKNVSQCTLRMMKISLIFIYYLLMVTRKMQFSKYLILVFLRNRACIQCEIFPNFKEPPEEEASPTFVIWSPLSVIFAEKCKRLSENTLSTSLLCYEKRPYELLGDANSPSKNHEFLGNLGIFLLQFYRGFCL